MPEVLTEWLETLTGEEADQVIEYLKIVPNASQEMLDFLDDL